MLIVNADDLGASTTTTDPVIDGFRDGLLTSATAMVWMPDSERAARLAIEHDLPVGLHLNLTLPFGADVVPGDVRSRQSALTRVFSPNRRRINGGHDLPDGLIAAALVDQLTRFRELFGEPTHIDGHHHVHINPAVLEQLPRAIPIRPPLDGFASGSFGERWLLRRFRKPTACLAYTRIHPALGGSGLHALDAASRQAVEVMVHPAADAERAALRSETWRTTLGRLPLGSYRDLD